MVCHNIAKHRVQSSAKDSCECYAQSSQQKIWQEIAQYTVENIATRKYLAGVGDHSLDIVCGIGHPSVYLVDCGSSSQGSCQQG
jgi:hypothetical protein